MSPGSAATVVEVRKAFHELLDVALDRACAPLDGGVFSSFAAMHLVEQEGGATVPEVPALPVGLALAIGGRSSAQLSSALSALCAVAGAAGDTVRMTKRSKGEDHAV